MAIDFLERCDAIEECYEFMLAYAGQGLPRDLQGEGSGKSQIRVFLERARKALDGLADSCRLVVPNPPSEAVRAHRNFISVIERDARDSLAAIEMVLAQPAISSQLIDNLNASLHLRALLTDLFLLGEIVRSSSKRTPAPARDER